MQRASVPWNRQNYFSKIRMQTLFQHPVSTPRREIDIRTVFKRLRLGSRGTKLAVILVFTLCWFVVALVRSNNVHGPISSEGSSLIGLASSMRTGAFSGRDFQSMYGVGTQFLAWATTAVMKAPSPIEAYSRMAFVFSAFSALLIAALLQMCDQFSWQDCAILYTFCFLLNLFFNTFDFRTALLLLSAVFAYRIGAAQRMRYQIVWATAAGLLCFAAQLLTFELGIYVFALIVAALIGGSILTRNPRGLIQIQTFVVTVVGANVVLAVLFKLTSPNYELLFDYPNYSLEILRGFHNGMGLLWQLPLPQTIVLILAFLYVVSTCVVVGIKSDPLEALLLGTLSFAAVIWVKTAAVQSDIPHITTAFTPVLVLLALLATRVWKRRLLAQMWAGTLILLLVIWPSFNLTAPGDLLGLRQGKVVSSEASHNSLEGGLVPGSMTFDLSDQGRVSNVAYSDDSHVSKGAPHRFFPPALETYAAFTHSLERYYIDALDQRSGEGLEVALADIRGITRTPEIFEYLYRHFGLVGNVDHGDGPFEIRERHELRDTTMAQLPFSTPQQLPDQGMLKLTAPTTCGIVRLEMRMEYEKDPLIFRPSGVELSLRNSGQLVWTGSTVPLQLDHSSVALVTTVPEGSLQSLFTQEPLQTPKWNTIEYSSSAADILGARARRIRIEKVQCMDPGRFVEAASTSEAALIK
jgi:hypothetical protein